MPVSFRPSLRRAALAALTGACLSAHAAATSLDFGVTYASPLGTSQAGLLVGRLGFSDVALFGGQFGVGASNLALDASYARTLAIPPAGAVTSRTDLAVTWQGGLRVASRVTGGLGPVALNVGGAYFTAPVTAFDPLAAWTLAPADTRATGWSADLTVRYRVSRTLIAVGGGEFSAQASGYLGVEGRQDLTQVVAPADPEVPDSEPETETVGTVTWRLGARAGQGVLGATAGVSYSTPAGFGVNVDALLGPDSLGLTASLGAADLFGEGSSLNLYAAYEPWRTAAVPVRFGLESALPAGPGTLTLDLRGGLGPQGAAGYGARVGYRLPLDALLNPAGEEGDSAP